MAATFSVSGLISGIDYNTMIDQIMQVEQQPITRMQSQQDAYKKQISAYGDLSSKLAALKTAAEGLKTASAFYSKTASVSDATVFDATASSSAATGNYSITVTTLAQAHRIASSQVADETAAVGATDGNFSFQVGDGDVTTVAVTADTTLADLRDAINAADGDAEGSIINDGTGYRLVLTSKVSGAANAISVTENATSLGLPTGPVSGGTTLQAAQDAAFTIDTLSMTRSSNTFSDAISGVSITLKQAGTGTLSVTNDTAAIQQKVEDFVTAYNDVVNLVSSDSTYDTTTNTGGPFAGEATARDVVNNLQQIIGGGVAGLPESLWALSQIGLKTERDGTLSIDDSVLSNMLSTNLSGVSDLFTVAGGVAGQISDYVDATTDTISGAITYRTKGINDEVSAIGNQISDMQTRLSAEEDSLRTQFSKLEALISSLSAQSSFLTALTSSSG